ncbi:MAG: hypothetical protein GF411_02735 [Candidatus Lokiarchaeota archaeon]|nr:hypothetical protein [Candidatus Lokiarchaeota archaeon]
MSEDIEKRMPHLVRVLTSKRSHWHGSDPEEYIRSIAEFDPTPNGTYMPYIVKQVSQDKLKLPEDGKRIHDALKYFHANKNKSGWEGHKDVHQYDKWRDLEDTVEKHEPVKSRSEKIKDIKSEGARVIVDVELPVKGGKRNLHYKAIEITTPEAACTYGRGSRWCTTDPGTASSYLEHGPLYIAIKNGEKIFQANHDFSQFMGIKDNPAIMLSAPTDYFLSKIADRIPETRKGIAKLRRMSPDYPGKPPIE